jgi:hypothetical protein
MEKTGESYTAARLHVVRSRAPEEPKPDYATLAGMSDDSVQKATGCTWERWVATLDRIGAASMKHGEIAKLVHEKFNAPPWWAQTVTVGYERIRGLRAIGQRRDGSYEANKSKTIAVPLAKLYEAFSNARVRSRWLEAVKVKVSSATPEKYLHFAWNDGSRVSVGFYAKGVGKSQVAVQHTKLSSRAEADRMKAYWTERLAKLAEVVSR